MPEKEYKVIHAHIFNPATSLFKTNANDKAELHTVLCSNSENCELFKKQQCVCRHILGGRCPYGKARTEMGYTKRAKNFSSWIEEKKEQHKDVPSLSIPPSKIAIIGEYIYLPYAHMSMIESVPLLSKSSALATGLPFLKKGDWTFENVCKLIKFRPRSLFGDEITSYRKEEIPKFITHLKDFDNKMFHKAMEEFPNLKVLSNIGRKAYLKSINSGEVVFDKKGEEKFVWDGKILKFVGNKKLTFWNSARNIEKFELTITPSDSTIVVITDENQVNKDTEFLD